MVVRRGYGVVGILLGLLALVATVVPHWSAAEEGQNVEPRIGYASQRFDFFATGFDNTEAVGFWATRPDGSVTEQGAGQVTANEDGRADWFWVAPADAPAGAWLIVAQGVESGVLRTLRIEIVGPDGVLPPPAPPVGEQPAPEQPAPGIIDTPPGTFIPPGYTLDPREITVYAGQEVTFVGTGFVPGERVASWATGPDAAVIGGQAGSANDDGRVAVAIVLPERAVGGRWLFTLKGDASQVPVTVVFDVIAIAPPPEQSQATVAPDTGTVGTTFQFVATGFDDGERVGYWITDPDGRVYTGDGRADDDAPDTTVDASERGVVRVSWRVPTGPTGIWVLTLQGVESGIARGIPFEVR